MSDKLAHLLQKLPHAAKLNSAFMKKIYKYPLIIEGEQLIDVPLGAQLLTAQVQHEVVCIWAIIDSNEEQRESRTIDIFGTGHPMSMATRKYLGTVQLCEGSLVFHVFERL